MCRLLSVGMVGCLGVDRVVEVLVAVGGCGMRMGGTGRRGDEWLYHYGFGA